MVQLELQIKIPDFLLGPFSSFGELTFDDKEK